MPPDEASVPGGQGCIPVVPRDAVRRQAPLPLELRVGRRNRRCPAWLVPACIVVSLAAGVRPEEARAIGWKEDGIGLDEGRLPELVKLQHALMPK